MPVQKERKTKKETPKRGERPVRKLFGIIPLDGSFNIFGHHTRGEYPESKEKLEELSKNAVQPKKK